MSPQRQDYLLRLLEELGRFVREALRSGERPKIEAALPELVQAQNKLFARPAAEFLGQPLEAQIDLLVQGESAETAVEKCVIYAGILHQAAQLYDSLGRPALALGSRQLAETILQTATARWPGHAAQIAEQGRDLAKFASGEPVA